MGVGNDVQRAIEQNQGINDGVPYGNEQGSR